MNVTGAPLVCRSCATSHSLEARFCPSCGMPLVYAPGSAGSLKPITEQHERARKVSPQYGEGPLVKVGWARNQAEAELISGLLLEEGIPSVVKRAGGFDVPDFLAAGPRDILVAESGAEHARELLASQLPDGAPAPFRPAAPWVQVFAWLMVGVVALSVALTLAVVLFA